MTTRSGKKYLLPHMCNKCNKGFHSNPMFDYKCSDCWDFCKKNGIMTNKEFGEKCRQWVRDNVVDEYGRVFILKNKDIPDKHLFILLTGIVENTGKYISAEMGLELFKAHPSNNRGHIVGSFIADWWEIKSRNVDEYKKWPSYMDCYYGFDGNSIENWSGINHASIPPKKPLGCKNHLVM